MSRMLEALKQIEARSPRPRPEPAPDQPAAEPPRDEAAMAAALDRSQAMTAAAIDGDPTPAEPAPEPSARPLPAVPPPLPPAGRASPQYAELARNILAQLPPGRPASLMFTGAAEGESTAPMLALLAEAMAERIDGEVLAVDADMAHRELAERLGVAAERGLADVLSGTARWQEVVRPTSVARLGVLPAGVAPVDDEGIPRSLGLGRLLEELCRRYRLVLLETASAVHPETAPAARHCDGAYLAVRLNHTTRRAVREAAEAVRRSGGRLLGCVVVDG